MYDRSLKVVIHNTFLHSKWDNHHFYGPSPARLGENFFFSLKYLVLDIKLLEHNIKANISYYWDSLPLYRLLWVQLKVRHIRCTYLRIKPQVVEIHAHLINCCGFK